ncbi:radical SAM protein [Rhizobium sp. BK176]|uniref:radical SAM protein n=1 Tax=Rhizobium sp. BK176 TaxID=2587071 RepID=UPI002169A71B|nr:radical SAM protein [Rhizobium sp. BK176]MCS4088492.1 adenine C2-methylase RlmN of 23S rRNA A2503 and tRNA A37 [Rhizobium sp. BK176]
MMNFDIDESIRDFSAIRSAMDQSVNFSRPTADGGMVETRFVRRIPTRFIVYISSMTGCDKACRFCHLTQTGQTMARLLSVDEMVAQAETVLAASTFSPGETVHFNFMARGEPLSNPAVGPELFEKLRDLAISLGLKPRVKLSTIMPSDFVAHDWATFVPDGIPVDMYYSLYRIDSDWRRRWIPKAMTVSAALDHLVAFQNATKQRVILHWALIAGENDAVEDAEEIGRRATASGLQFDFNLVRYNAANGKSSEAPRERIDAYLGAMSRFIAAPNRVKEIPRVGFDVAASCGMFLTAA